MILRCNSCGANVDLGNNASAACEFCGNLQHLPIKAASNTNRISSIISKPAITPARFSYSPQLRMNVQDSYCKLALRNKNISNLEEIFNWFSDNELDQIEILDISGNQIVNIEKAFELNSLLFLVASNNQIKDINFDFKTYGEFKLIDLTNNQLTSYESFGDCKVEKLILAGNKINKFSPLNYTRYIDLSNNLIDSVLGLQNIRGEYPLSSIFTVILLNNNPLKDNDKIKDLSINILPIDKYDNDVLDPNGKFKEVRKDLNQSWRDIKLQGLFEWINNRCFYVYFGDIGVIDNKLNIIYGKDLTMNKYYNPTEHGNYKFVKIGTNKKHEWGEFCEYFGLKVKAYKKKNEAIDKNETNFKPLLIIGLVLIAIVLYFLISNH